MTKPLVIYHANCADGTGAAYCAWLRYKDEAEYFPALYNTCDSVDQLDKLPPLAGRVVYILDFSFSVAVTTAIADQCESLVWLDHHKSAIDAWCGESFLKSGESRYVFDSPQRCIVLDNNKSGCKLAWEYFESFKAPLWVNMIDDRDRWQFNLYGSKAFNAAISLERPWTFESWDKMLDEPVGDIVNRGHAVLRAYDQQVASIAKHGRECVISLGEDSKQGLAINTNVHISEVGHELALKSGTYGLVWYLGDKNVAKCSLRSNGDYDVSVMAKQFGGGGHKNAAGFSIDIQMLLMMLK